MHPFGVLSKHKRFVVGGSVFLLSLRLAVSLSRWIKSRELRRKAQSKREKEQSYIKSKLEELEHEIDHELAEEILALSTRELGEKLRLGLLQPADVLKAYLWKACKATTSLNCVTEIIRDCHEIAHNLSEDSRKEMPLYGVPVSLKECYQTKGLPSTMGCAIFLDNIALDDCVVAKVLKKCGAVPFVKTNIPQVMLSLESGNPIYGETGHPANPEFGPGGSSSGEGSIIGAGASPLGFGTDIGGSIRIPSHFCGISGFKPTKNRLSAKGLGGSLPGQTDISATLGPMAKDVDTLVIAMRALLSDAMFQLDFSVPAIPFRDEIYNSRESMRIGYFEDNGYMEPIPACRRAVQMTKEALERAGFTLIPYKIPDMANFMELALKALYADGGETILNRLRGDIIDKSMMYSWKKWNLSPIMRRILIWIYGFKSKRIANELAAYGGGDKSVFGLWKNSAELSVYRRKFWAEWREKYKIDAIICPVSPTVACPKGKNHLPTVLASYCVLYNALNCPAGVVPVTKVDEKDIRELEHYRGHYGDDWDHHIKEASKDSINMPVGVQCVTPPWQEEKCLRLMKEIENLLNDS